MQYSLFVILFNGYLCVEECPDVSALLKPCLCEIVDGKRQVICEGKDAIDLKAIFAKLSHELV
ncbi:unnamed protein product, partial [Oppiella nova]